MKLRPEYADIASAASHLHVHPLNDYRTQIVYAVEKCQELADRPTRMLTDVEVLKITQAVYCTSAIQDGSFARAIEAAHIAKQKEPEVIPFDYREWSKGGWQAIGDQGQKIDSLLPKEEYTMRRIT